MIDIEGDVFVSGFSNFVQMMDLARRLCNTRVMIDMYSTVPFSGSRAHLTIRNVMYITKSIENP